MFPVFEKGGAGKHKRRTWNNNQQFIFPTCALQLALPLGAKNITANSASKLISDSFNQWLHWSNRSVCVYSFNILARKTFNIEAGSQDPGTVVLQGRKMADILKVWTRNLYKNLSLNSIMEH